MLYSSSLIVALIVAMLVFVDYQADRFTGERIVANLEEGTRRVSAIETERLGRLQLIAQLVASFPELKAMLDTDYGTIRDFLQSYRLEHRHFELLIVLDASGRVVARTDSPAPGLLQDAETRWVKPSLAGQPALGVLATDSGVYYAAAVPAEAGGTVFGFVIAGSIIDSTLARTLGDVSHDEVIIVADRLLGSTLPEHRLPWKTRAEWEPVIGGKDSHRILDISGEDYLGIATSLGREGGPRPLAVILQSRDRAIAPYRRIQIVLLVLGLLATVSGISGSALVAGSVTAPVGKLVEGMKQVAAGNFDHRLDIRSGDEIGDLANSFNFMIQGLRERADMQKFVSQSTFEMIQASSQKSEPASERVVRTIFFSDIRGFTPMAERQPPEEVVRILNRCLTLQAESVKKYQGDIDKYVGDCVVALFDGQDMELNAIRCAIEIQKKIETLNSTHPDEEPLYVGVGIATGEVILGSIGSEDRLDYTVIGSYVNLCSRLCSMAGPGEILLAESTYERVKDLVAARRLEPLKVKGFSEMLSVYKMTIR